MDLYKPVLLIALVLSSAFVSSAQRIDVVPRPDAVVPKSGEFKLGRKTKIVSASEPARRMAGILNGLLKRNFGLELEVTDGRPAKNKIELIIALPSGGARLGEDYTLEVTRDSITIAGTEAGAFYGIQTLMQLLPAAGGRASYKVPAVEIRDQPRFGYRGMHLDVSRHFFTVEFVKKYIDLMSQYKFNTFHWHLTDDQGWRIEIKKYPRLTEVGSKRPETVVGRNLSPYIGDKTPVEGFYTQDEIRDVVAYARARYVTVIPEIELPGHASAAIAAYPQLGCKTDLQYKVQTTWGIFKETFCPTDETFKFLEDVLAEVIELFPDSPYIHIGGDEVLKDHWKESEFVQQLKQRESLKDEHEVQSYFVRRIERFINSKGKKIIGWDEILEGGVAPNATIMSWRGERGGIEAAKAKHDVIMTPNTYVYFDYGQGDPAFEPLNIGSYIPLAKVYGWDPVPKDLTADEARYILGGQANVWTEYLKTPQAVEYMAFPRMIALAEALWTRPENKDHADFARRLAAHLPRLDRQNVNYRIPEPAGLRNMFVPTAGDGKVELALTPFAAGQKIYYTTDGSTPDERSAEYRGPIALSLASGEIKTLKTIVATPTGRKSVVYAATIVRRDPLPASTLSERRPGVDFELLIPNDDARAKDGVIRAETRSITLDQFARSYDLKKPFAVTFDGYINAPVDGVYELQADATWDVTVVLDGEKLIDDAGTKDRRVRSAIVPLKAGLHKISLRYNHRGGDATFRFLFGQKGQGLSRLYGGEFVH
ncbi:MAG: family 20 glycosylhydrolase [Pyrinomonadaceae bacterium]